MSNGKAGTSIADRFWTLPNALSIVRVLLTIPFALVMFSDTPNREWWGIAILALAALTDKFDGVLARHYHEVTEWGKILDPLADKIGIGVVAVVLVLLNLIPVWFVAAIIVRDVLILVGGLYLRSRVGVVPQSNQLGKWTIGALALAMFFAMLQWHATLTQAFVWISVAMLAGSLALYVHRFISLIGVQTHETK